METTSSFVHYLNSFFKKTIKKGDFNSVYKNNGWHCRQCIICYSVLENIGPDAWSFVKIYPCFYEQADTNSILFKKIIDGLMACGISHNQELVVGMAAMYIIAKSGWEKYVKIMNV